MCNNIITWKTWNLENSTMVINKSAKRGDMLIALKYKLKRTT